MTRKNIALRENIIMSVFLLLALAGVLSLFGVAFGYWFYKRPPAKITSATFTRLDTTSAGKPWTSFENDTVTVHVPSVYFWFPMRAGGIDSVEFK